MNTNDQVARELLFMLKEEYSFYQSLYITLDKQRDMIKYEKDDKLIALFTEIRRCHERIRKSDEKVAAIRIQHPQAFQQAARLPEIRKLVSSIMTMVRKNMGLVAECEDYLRGRYDRIKLELGELKNSEKILKYLSDGAETAPQFVDGKN